MSDELLHRLELFIRRYYKNQLLKGAILGSTGLLAVFLFVNVFEYYGRFSSGVRAFFFYGFIAFFLLVIWHYLARPLRGLFRLGNTMSHAEAARIIGSHFSHVSDKLLNLLQLREQAQHHPDNALLLAGITQKTTELRPVPFQAAVNFSENKKYLRYLALPLVALLCILLFQGSIISEGTKRLVSYNKEFPKQAPFAFQLLNSTLKFPRNTEVTLQLATPGTVIPAEMYLESEGQLIRMEQKGSGRFSLTLPPLEGNTSVRFVSGEFNSTEYLLELVPQPELAGAEITLDYPDYTGLETKTLYNTGDLNIPEGTTVKWKFSTRDAQALQMFFGRERIEVPAGESKGGFALSRKFLQSTPWGFLLLNPLSVNRDTAKHQLLVIPDHAPALATEYKTDSSTGTEWCIGTAGDDYGLSRAAFHVRILNSEDASRKGREMPAVSVPVDKSTQSVFSWPVSPEQLGLLPGEEAEYWFEVWDNDGIHGAKSTRSIPRKTSRKTENQLKNEADKTASGMKSKMEKAMSQAEEIRKQALEIQKKLAEQKTMQWDSKEKISQLMNKQKKLEENIEQIKKDNVNCAPQK